MPPLRLIFMPVINGSKLTISFFDSPFVVLMAFFFILSKALLEVIYKS